MKTAYDIVIKPIITETSMDEVENRKYTFQVDKKANKTQIKHAVEEIFDVQVEKVNVMNLQGKLKRMGRNIGRRPDVKKAIITLTPDSKEIEFFEGM